jgi:Protein of unknown function (DUF2971)
MRVYHFTSAKYAIDDIERRRLKVSRFSELNDPFELLAADLLDSRHRDAFDKFKKEVNNMAGIVCFSGAWGNPLLWGHYANKHSGIALGFDVSEELLIDVHYTSFRPKIKFDTASRKVVDGHQVLDKLIRTKFTDWKYENESRMFVKLDNSPNENGNYFVDFSSKLTLREVILGINCNASIEGLRKLVNSNAPKVKIMKAGMALRKFKVIEDRSYRAKDI